MTAARIAEQLAALAVPIDSLAPLDGNPRRGSVEAVAASLAEFGQLKPVVYRVEDGIRTLVAGNHTWRAARSLGWDAIAAIDATDLGPERAAAFALADNRTGDIATFDHDALVAFIADTDMDAELLAAAAFSDADIAALTTAVPVGTYDDTFTDLIDPPTRDGDRPAPIDVPGADTATMHIVTTKAQRDDIMRILRADTANNHDLTLGDALHARVTR